MASSPSAAEKAAAEERKRKRREAWRKRQAAAKKPKISLSISASSSSSGGLSSGNKKTKNNAIKKKKSKLNKKAASFFGGEGEEGGGSELSSDQQALNEQENEKRKKELTLPTHEQLLRFDVKKSASSSSSGKQNTGSDALDEFMKELKPDDSSNIMMIDDVSQNKNTFTDDEIKEDPNNVMNEEDEESARRSLIDALKKAPVPANNPILSMEKKKNNIIKIAAKSSDGMLQLASEVKDEKQRREDRLKQLSTEAELARQSTDNTTEIGRLFNDGEDGVMEEAERVLDVLTAAPDALEILAELNKKKELKSVDHSKIDYIPFKKNLYIVPRHLAKLTKEQMSDLRAKIKVRVRGVGNLAPVSSFAECGLSERILGILNKQKITSPFPIQAQCLPAIMAGRDVIGIAKTGSGKTLAYMLPMLRHILDQPDLRPHESGPIGLILAPARELAVQIHSVCKVFSKRIGIKSTAVYGGAGVAEQIGDLKRGTHIAVATPGRMIDILTMQSGKILSLSRVSYVVMDEADRMFDMGFEPQISAILSAVRPDRQTVLFSATFPKAVENLARKSLNYPLEVIVGGRSVASDSVTQYGEVCEEEDKFLRLLQLLGEHVENGKKVIVFVDTQERADNIFQQLISFSYSALSLHGGKEQEDRDSTISDFKRVDGPLVLVATSVAGRGLDVPSCGCVINYSTPNHLEDYVHRVGRTGRAGNKGVSYTFVNSGDEAKFAPNIVKAMREAGQSTNISPELKKLSEGYIEKVKKGEARWANSGFHGKGFTYDKEELNDAQKLARLEKRQALLEAGLLDPDEEEDVDSNVNGNENSKNDDSFGATSAAQQESSKDTKTKPEKGIGAAVDLSNKLSANVLALPGMQDAILKKAGVVRKEDGTTEGGVMSTNANHFIEEIEINDYPREARWKVTQKETTSRLQDEFQTAVTLKGEYFGPNRVPAEGERRLYLHLEATTERILKNCIKEIQRLLTEETLRVSSRSVGGRYNVL